MYFIFYNLTYNPKGDYILRKQFIFQLKLQIFQKMGGYSKQLGKPLRLELMKHNATHKYTYLE